MYALIIPRSVERDIKRLPGQLNRLLVSEHLTSIQSNPHQGGFLHGKSRGLRKYALSYKGTEYRVIYKISEATKSVILIMIGSRESFYKKLKRRT